MTNVFVYRIRLLRDNNMEMPDNFSNEIAKWALECKIFKTAFKGPFHPNITSKCPNYVRINNKVERL